MRALRPSHYRHLPVLVAAIVAFPCSAIAAGLLGGDDKKQEAKPAAEAGEDSTLVDSPMFKLGWPKIEMPKFAWKPGFGGGESAAPDSTAMTPEGNPISRALDKVADTSKSAADKVRGAWGAAINKLTPGGDEATQTAKADKPGFFSRMFAAEEPKQSETVQEFLAQERVGTTR